MVAVVATMACGIIGWLSTLWFSTMLQDFVRHRLPASCCNAIDAILGDDRAILWPWPGCRRQVFHHMRKIVERAGLAAPKTGHNLFHKVRRSALTILAATDPAIAQRTAGHAEYRTTLKHYIDPRLCVSRSAADILPEPHPILRVVG